MTAGVRVLDVGWRDLLKRSSESGADWEAWANEKRWTYEEPAPDLVGRFYPPPSDPQSGEEYPFSVSGVHGDLEFVCFARRTWSHRGRQSRYEDILHLAVRLPHTPRADLRAMPAEQAFRSLGSRLAGRFSYDWHDKDWLLGAGRGVEPVEVEISLAQLDSQVALAPPEAWEAGT